MTRPTLASHTVEASSLHEAIELYFESGWTDGLPVVPPDENTVVAFLAAGGRAPDEVLGVVPARRRVITAEKIAINAVMAGCRPEYMPVVNAAVEAICDPAFNLHACSASTGGAAVLVIVHGPAARQLGVNHGYSLFGPGFRANATIGRAIRLVIQNVCGGVPGVMDLATLGHPGKFSYCVAEDEHVDVWTPLHVERGLRLRDSAVTVFAAEAPHQVANEESRTPEGILASVARAMADPANQWYGAGHPHRNYGVVICPQHREYILGAGWSKRRVREFLFENARVTREELWRAGRSKKPRGPGKPFLAVGRPDDILLLTGGSDAGGFSAVLPPWVGGSSMAVTKRVADSG